MSSTNRPSRTVDITRRRLLGGTVAGAAALAAVPRPATATDQRVAALDRDTVVEHLHSRPYIDAVAPLDRELTEAGWEPDIGGAVGHRAEDGIDGPSEVVVVPYSRESTDEQAILLWSDTEDLPDQVRRFEPTDDGRVRMRTTLASRRGPVSSVALVDPAIWWIFCSDVNWACLFSVAGAWTGTIAGCGACLIDPSRLTCLACAGAAMSATGTTLGCSICDG